MRRKRCHNRRCLLRPVFAFLHGHNVLVGNGAIVPPERAATFERQPDAAIDIVACSRHDEREDEDERNDGDEDHSDHDTLVLAMICNVSSPRARLRDEARSLRRKPLKGAHGAVVSSVSWERKSQFGNDPTEEICVKLSLTDGCGLKYDVMRRVREEEARGPACLCIC